MTGPNYNSNTTGGTLQGIAGLIRGLSSLNDPDKQKRDQLLQLLQSNPQIRDQYIQQFQSNPDAINALIGKKPMIGGGKGSYDEITGIMKGQLTPQTQAANAEAQNRLALAQAQAPIISQGAKVDAFVNRGVGGVPQPAPTEQTPGVENIPVVKGPGISADDWTRYNEAMSRGGIQNPTERAGQEAVTEREQMLTQRTKESIPLEKDKDRALAQSLKQKESDRNTAQAILAQYPKGNLYDLNVAGKITNAQVDAISRYNKDLWDKDQNAHFENERIQIEQSNASRLKDQVANQKRESLRNQIAGEAMRAGAPISLAQIDQAIDRPAEILKSDAPEDQPIKDSLLAIRKYYAKTGSLEKAKAQFLGAYKSWQSGLKGKEPNDQDIKRLNTDSQAAFMGSGYSPFVFGLTPTQETKGMLMWKSPRMTEGVLSADPDLVKDAPVPIIKPTKATTPPNPQTPSAPSVTTQADIFESVKKKHPTESADQIIARMNKGER